MNFFLGVIKNKKELTRGENSYWCVYRNSNSEPDDILFMYETGLGIVQIFKIISEPSISGEFKCEMRRMLTVKTELITNLSSPISFTTLKNHPVFGSSAAVRRNFQSVLFSLSEENGNALIQTIKQQNPDFILPI